MRPLRLEHGLPDAGGAAAEVGAARPTRGGGVMSEHPERAVRCAACGAEPGEPCRASTDTWPEPGGRAVDMSAWTLRGASHQARVWEWKDSRPRSAWPRTRPDVREMVLNDTVWRPADGGGMSWGSRFATASGG